MYRSRWWDNCFFQACLVNTSMHFISCNSIIEKIVKIEIKRYTKHYRFFRRNPITMQPQKNPCRVLLELHGNSTEGFFLKNLYCLECMFARICVINRKRAVIFECPEDLRAGCTHPFFLYLSPPALTRDD